MEMESATECPVARRTDAEEEAIGEVEMMCASANRRANWIEATIAKVIERVSGEPGESVIVDKSPRLAV